LAAIRLARHFLAAAFLPPYRPICLILPPRGVSSSGDTVPAIFRDVWPLRAAPLCALELAARRRGQICLFRRVNGPC